MAETASITPPSVRGAQRRRRAVGLLATATLALGGAILAPMAAHAATQPEFTADVTEIANERIDIAIEGDGYGDVQALPGQTEPHVYFTLTEKGSDLSEVGQADTAISAEVAPDGTVSDVLSVPGAELEEGTAYEVISWPSRSFPTEANLYARADVTIDWTALFPAEAQPQPAQPSFTADVTEAPNEGIDIAIEGAGYDDVQVLPGQTEPHAYFTVVEKGSELSDVSQTDTAISASIEADGTLSDVLSVPADELVEGASYEVISWPSRSNPSEENLYARTDITIDWAALFPGAEIPGGEIPGEETPGEETPGNETPGEEIPGGEEPGEETPGEETPGEETPGNETPGEEIPGGEEPGEETPGEETPGEETPSNETPVTVTITGADGEAVSSVTQGDAIEFAAGPVAAGSQFTVTVESDPVVLEAATAGADGVASTTWTVPDDFETGEHTVTFASADGSDSYSAAFEVRADGSPDDDAQNDGAAGGVATPSAATNGGGGSGSLAATGTDATNVLVGIAGVLTLLGAAVLVASRRASAGSVR
ncbi:LPXTG cell wall anchor domain-containing protein [Microbacterium suaedae]|uniref:LPXTG cell wall anchor domain-containing protein n=1 Tax=Microbacterium suaedae TaxID=2067813 RepID=UPI0013A67385|nr:LPXTG cell wall anchor domain-containing protein [Microbacterium suaedae]